MPPNDSAQPEPPLPRPRPASAPSPKTWAILVTSLYLTVLLVLTVPHCLIAFGSPIQGGIAIGKMFEVYTVWQYWAILGVMGLCQYALLALPVRVASRRPETAGAIWPTVLAGAFMMALLAVGAGASLSELGDNGIPPSVGRIILGLALTSWLGWSIQFWRTARRTPGAAAIKRQTRTLLAGSVLELLIAVPSHIIVRHRHVCCAGLLTFFGLTCGVSVMLFAFGPAVFFLFAERWKRLHPAAAAAPAQKT